jgi:hypothetical protein
VHDAGALYIASNHADGEEAVAATLNIPQGKGKQVVDQGEGTSSRFKKKKKNDKCRCGDNFVTTAERKTSRPKGHSGKPAPTRDHFEKLLDPPCSHHEVPVKHMLRECRLMKNYVKSTLKPKTADHSDNQGPSKATMATKTNKSSQASLQLTHELGGYIRRMRSRAPTEDLKNTSDTKIHQLSLSVTPRLPL